MVLKPQKWSRLLLPYDQSSIAGVKGVYVSSMLECGSNVKPIAGREVHAMPVDPAKLRAVQDHNDRVIDALKVLSKKLGALDAGSYDEICVSAKAALTQAVE